MSSSPSLGPHHTQFASQSGSLRICSMIAAPNPPDTCPEFLVDFELIFPFAIVEIDLHPIIFPISNRLAGIAPPAVFTCADVVGFIVEDNIGEKTAPTRGHRVQRRGRRRQSVRSRCPIQTHSLSVVASSRVQRPLRR